MSILFSLGHIFNIMLNFCMKSLHFFLGFPKENGTAVVLLETHHQSRRNIPSPASSGLSFVTFSGDTDRPSNVVEWAAIKQPPPPSTPTTTVTAAAAATSTATVKKDPGGLGFLDDIGGSVDGLMSCTESLGFESSDGRRVDDQIDRITNGNFTSSREWKRSGGVKRRRDHEVKKFPPPLSSLSHDGKPTFFLRPVRKDGRLELTEVKIDRMEVLRASRQDGRLRLHLIRDVEVEDEYEEEEEGVEVEKIEDNIIEEVEEEEEEEEEKIEDTIGKDEEEEKMGEKWVFLVTNGGGDGFRRCHEVASRHHNHNRHHHDHHNLHAWGQHCLTIR